MARPSHVLPFQEGVSGHACGMWMQGVSVPECAVNEFHELESALHFQAFPQSYLLPQVACFLVKPEGFIAKAFSIALRTWHSIHSIHTTVRTQEAPLITTHRCTGVAQSLQREALTACRRHSIDKCFTSSRLAHAIQTSERIAALCCQVLLCCQSKKQRIASLAPSTGH
jgi:hypothetical protein